MQPPLRRAGSKEQLDGSIQDFFVYVFQEICHDSFQDQTQKTQLFQEDFGDRFLGKVTNTLLWRVFFQRVGPAAVVRRDTGIFDEWAEEHLVDGTFRGAFPICTQYFFCGSFQGNLTSTQYERLSLQRAGPAADVHQDTCIFGDCEHLVDRTFREEFHHSVRDFFRDGLLDGNFEDCGDEHLVERSLRDNFADDFPGFLFRVVAEHLVE